MRAAMAGGVGKSCGKPSLTFWPRGCHVACYAIDRNHRLCVMSAPGTVGKSRVSNSSGKLACTIEIDGGIGPRTAGPAVKAGVGILVAGVSIFAAPDGVAEAVRRLRASAQAA
jgi:pentose-5-phosphate-3-epimerase